MKSEETSSTLVAKSRRLCKPKVRTGCITCKIRRVKCDETKPSCNRCTSTGRKCDGFAPPKPLMFEICADDRERRSFHYFRERTVSEICSYNTSSFWSRLVLQASYSREPVRHALVAVGSFHESLENIEVEKRVSQTAFTLEQYNKAISSLTSDSKLLSTEDILIACIIFVFLENLQGRFDTALQHLQNGLNILEGWRSRRILGKSSNASSSTIQNELSFVFDSLHVQASVFLRGSRSREGKAHSSELPAKFDSLCEAHHFFYQLVHWTCDMLEVLPKEESLKEVRDALIPPQCATYFVKWLAIFETSMPSGSEEFQDSMTAEYKTATLLGILQLKINFRVVIILLRCIPFGCESVFDHQIHHFEVMLKSIRDFVSLCSTPGFDLIEAQQIAGFEFNIISSLSMIGCRCRDPKVRRQAIEILRSRNWREDIWDSYDASDVAEQVMKMEEQGLEVKICADVPDNQRVHLVGCTSFRFSEQTQTFEVMPHYEHHPDWIKMTCVRSGRNPMGDDCEDIWFNRRGTASTLSQYPVSLPQDVDGLFPQIVKPNSPLWKYLSGARAKCFMGRFHANNIFASQHSRATGLDGDFVTLSGEFTEYLATDRRHSNVNEWSQLSQRPQRPLERQSLESQVGRARDHPNWS